MVHRLKKDIRGRIQGQRDKLTVEEREELSRRVAGHLWDMPEFKAAHTVFFFISFRSEVSTEPMIRRAIAEGKRVCIPYTYPETKAMVASRLLDFDAELQVGNYDILEPKEEFIRPVAPADIDLIITPGVAFDVHGGRLGYGGGYYDRFFAQRKEACPLVALAFEMQMMEEVPRGDHDQPVDAVVTEERVIDCKCPA